MQTVLIVDGDFGYGERLRAAVESMGLPAHTATDGLEALRWMRSTTPGLVLVDQAAPWVDGFRVCRLVKFHKRYQKIPVYILAVVADEAHRRLAQAVQCDGYVEKMSDEQGMVELVRKALNL